MVSATAVIYIQQALPSAFVRTYLANIEGPQTMVLESCVGSGGKWQVTYTNESCFEEGWQVFSADYDLGSGDVIKFQLKGKFQFMVQVYSKSGCEKFSSFDAGASNTWTNLRRRATAASEGTLTYFFLVIWSIFLYHTIDGVFVRKKLVVLHQWSGRFLGIIDGDPSVCKSNWLRVDILWFSFIKLGYIL